MKQQIPVPNLNNHVGLDFYRHRSWQEYLHDRTDIVGTAFGWMLRQNNNAFYTVSPEGNITVTYNSEGPLTWSNLVRHLEKENRGR